MKISRILPALFAALLAFAAMPAHATSEHEYAKGEYGIIRDGLAPNKQMSLASHGDGDGGRDNFHVWLMAEPAHRRITALDDVSSSNNLDTGPDAYYAAWWQTRVTLPSASAATAMRCSSISTLSRNAVRAWSWVRACSAT